MKKTLIILMGFLFLIIITICNVNALILEKNIVISPDGSNTTYILGNDLIFSNVTIINNAIYFNNSIFKIEPDSGTATVTIHNLNSMSFTVTATNNVVFTLDGFTASSEYNIFVDGNKWDTTTTDNNGILSFNYNSWSTHIFSFSLTTNTINLFPIADTAIALFIVFFIILIVSVMLCMLYGKMDANMLLVIVIMMAIVFVMLFVLVIVASTLSNVSYILFNNILGRISLCL